jgi:HAD superfamily hydrolase (TIGR01509 family)
LSRYASAKHALKRPLQARVLLLGTSLQLARASQATYTGGTMKGNEQHAGPAAYAVLWDMDGVLVDSGDLHRRAWRRYLVAQGKPVSDEIFRQGFGQPNEQVLPIYFGDLGEDEIRRMSEEKEACYRDLVRAEGARATPGALEWMARFAGGGVRQAMATSGCRANADLIIDRMGIRAYLSAVVTSEDVTRGKPHPDVFLCAAAQLGLPTSHCVVIEDSVHGVRAARAAGMHCVAIQTTHPARELSEADLVLPDMRAFSWVAWHALFGDG